MGMGSRIQKNAAKKKIAITRCSTTVSPDIPNAEVGNARTKIGMAREIISFIRFRSFLTADIMVAIYRISTLPVIINTY